ncbi:MAG TPA: GDSL-type esterase/lipase family protein, partial [Fibrobacteria bacterium]|nr:GDSL-type esterase/lipase family protein [Fibrobacteria bacterium]
MDQGLAAAAARMNVDCPTRSGARLATGVLAALGLLAGVSDAGAQVPRRIRWAALGNSITQGSGYPDKLQALLGPAFLVENEGVSATTMLKKSNYSYWTNGRFAQTFAFKPDIVSVKLGTNDSKPANWPAGRSAFLADTRAMVDTLRGMPSKPLAFLCYPVPVFQKNGAWAVDGINDPVIKNEIMPFIKQVAEEKQTGLIDLHTFLENRGDLFAGDGVHPDAGKAGGDSIAMGIFRAFKAQAIRVACIGNSITDNGHNAQAYPVRLNMRLGRDHFVLNAGHSGYTLLRKGDLPYYKSPWFAEVFKFQPQVITIKLGTNDTKAYNWDAHKDEFVSDLRWMVDTLMTMAGKPRIYLCTPIPVWKNSDGSDPFGIRGEVILNEVIPKIKQVAEEKGLKVLDLHTPFLPYQRLTSDGVHPNAEGLDTL